MTDGISTTEWSKALTDTERRPDLLEPIDINVGLVLQVFADWQTGGSCWPSIDTLAEASGRARTTVMPALDRLEDAGCIRRERGSMRKPTHYFLVKFWTEQSSDATTEQSQETTTESLSSSHTNASGSDRHASSSHGLTEQSRDAPLPPNTSSTTSTTTSRELRPLGDAPQGGASLGTPSRPEWRWWSPLVEYACGLQDGRWSDRDPFHDFDSSDFDAMAKVLHEEHVRGLSIAQIIANMPVPEDGQKIHRPAGFLRSQLKDIEPRDTVPMPTNEFFTKQLRDLIVSWFFARPDDDFEWGQPLLNDVTDPVLRLRLFGFSLTDQQEESVNKTWRLWTVPDGHDEPDQRFAEFVAGALDEVFTYWVGKERPEERAHLFQQVLVEATEAWKNDQQTHRGDAA